MARTQRKARGKSGSISVDFTGVESSGKVSEGRQLLTVDGTPEVKTSEGSGNDYINWKFKADGGVVYHTTSLQPQALWNLRNTLEALGLEVPESSMDLDLSEMDGLTCGGEIEHEVYQGKKRPRIIDLFPEEELEEGEEEQPKKAAAKSGSKQKAEPEPEEADLTWAELQEMEKDDLIELAGENDVKLTVKLKKDVDALRSHIASELGIEEEEAEEEEADEPTFESVQEMDKDELLALAEENDIKVPVKTKKDLDALRDLICEELELEEAPAKPAAKTTSRRKTGGKELAKGSKVTFVDDGEDLEGTVKSINTKEKFAVIDVDGEEWEVELDDLTVA